jgi:hypothetical protein
LLLLLLLLLGDLRPAAYVARSDCPSSCTTAATAAAAAAAAAAVSSACSSTRAIVGAACVLPLSSRVCKFEPLLLLE